MYGTDYHSKNFWGLFARWHVILIWVWILILGFILARVSSRLLRQSAARFLMDDIYRNPGPLQFDGPGADSKPISLCVEDQDYMGRIKELQVHLDKVLSMSSTTPPHPSKLSVHSWSTWGTSSMVYDFLIQDSYACPPDTNHRKARLLAASSEGCTKHHVFGHRRSLGNVHPLIQWPVKPLSSPILACHRSDGEHSFLPLLS